jgi:hypothetical protein
MKLRHVILSIVVGLVVINALFVGGLWLLRRGAEPASKHSPTATQQNPKVAALGVVDVSDGVESRHDLGGGRACTIMPAVQKDGSVLLTLRIEEDGRLLASLPVQAFSDRVVEVSVGDIGFALTPHIKQ